MSPRQPRWCERCPLHLRCSFPAGFFLRVQLRLPACSYLSRPPHLFFVLLVCFGGRTDVVPLPPVFPVQWGQIWGLGCFHVHPVRRESTWVVPLWCPCQSSDGLASSSRSASLARCYPASRGSETLAPTSLGQDFEVGQARSAVGPLPLLKVDHRGAPASAPVACASFWCLLACASFW